MIFFKHLNKAKDSQKDNMRWQATMSQFEILKISKRNSKRLFSKALDSFLLEDDFDLQPKVAVLR